MYRRRLLGTLAGLSAVGGAGCTAPTGSGGGSAGVAHPSLPERRLTRGGWTEAADPPPARVYQREFGGVGRLSATENTVIFEDAALNSRLRDETMGAFPGENETLRLFFATRAAINSTANLDTWPGVRDEVFDGVRAAANEEFAARLRDNGVEDVDREDDGTISVEGGHEASVTRHTGRYRYERMTVPVTADESLDLDGGTVDVEGIVAAWRPGDDIRLAGGAYPAETVEEELTADLTDAITVTVDVDLGLSPDRYRTELRDLVAGVE